MKGKFQNSNKVSKTFQFFTGILIAIFLLTTLTIVFTDGDMHNIQTIKRMQLIQSVCLFVVLPLILAYLWSDHPFSYLQLNTKTSTSSYLLVVATMLVSIPFINYLSFLNRQITFPEFLSGIENWMRTSETELQELTLRLVNVNHFTDLIFNILLIAVLAGLGEELMFRGVLLKLLGEWKSGVYAIWIAAFIFSSIHMQFFGFFPRLLLGALFGYMLIWSGNLWLPILAHTINNGVAVVFYYMKFNGYNVVNIDEIGTNDTVYLAAVSVLFTVLCVAKLRNRLILERRVS